MNHLFKVLSILIILCSGINVLGQEYNVEWSEEGLNFSDFQADIIESPFTGEIHYLNKLETKTIKDSINQVKQKIQVVKTYMSPDLSWMVDKTDSVSLKYYQTIFDINRKHALIYTKKINVNRVSVIKVYKMLDSMRHEAKLEIHQLKKETKYGSEDSEIIKWYDKIKSEISNMEEPDFDYNYGDTYLYLGMGINHKRYGSDLIHSNVGYTMDVGFTIKKINFDMLLDIVGLKINSPISTNDFNFTSDSTVTASTIQLNLGYDVIQKNRFILTPTAGLSMTQINRNFGMEQRDVGELRQGLALNLNALYVFKHGEQSNLNNIDFYLKGTVSYHPLHNFNQFNTNQLGLNLTIGYYIRQGQFKIKN